MNVTPVAMKATPVAMNEKSGDSIRPTLGPLNRSEETHFGLIDGLIIAFFVLFTGALVSLVSVLLSS
jgi:hypothetical protein